MDRKIIIMAGLLGLLIIVLIVFLATRGERKEIPQTTTLTIWDSFDKEENFSKIFNQYQAENKNVEIKFVKKDPGTLEEDSINAIAAGTGPDVWVIPNNWLPKHHDKLASLEEKKLDLKHKKTNAKIYEQNFLNVAYQDNVINGQVYGIPLFIDSLALFYQSELFNNKLQEYVRTHRGDTSQARDLLIKPPTFWEDLEKLIEIYGEGTIALGSAQNIDRSADILTALMLQYGAKMTSEDNTSALFHTSAIAFGQTPNPGAKAIEFYTSFVQKNNPHYTWPNLENSYQAFIDKKVAMMIDWSRKAKDIKKDSGKTGEVTSLPQFKDSQNPQNIASYQTLTVPKTGQNISAAWDLILYLANSQIVTEYLINTGLASARKDKVEASTNYLDIQNKYAISWYNPEPAKVEEIFNLAIDQVLAGQASQTVIEGAAAQITSLLGAIQK